MAKTSAWASLYFIALMTFGNYVLFNLLVAILVEGFSTEVSCSQRSFHLLFTILPSKSYSCFPYRSHAITWLPPCCVVILVGKIREQLVRNGSQCCKYLLQNCNFCNDYLSLAFWEPVWLRLPTWPSRLKAWVSHYPLAALLGKMAWWFAQSSEGCEFESHQGPNSVVSKISQKNKIKNRN